jgi:hypothetical protein
MGGIWWMLQSAPIFVVSLVQMQPISRSAGEIGTDPSSFPDDWLVSYDDYNKYWRRDYVDQPLMGGHVLYLVGLTVLCVCSALRVLRGPGVTQPALLRRRLRWIGCACVVGGILVQLWAIGFSLTPRGIGEGQVP